MPKFLTHLFNLLNIHWFLITSLVIVGIFYTQTMMPGQDFHDAGEFQAIVPILNIGHPTGYPTYVILGRILITLIPVGEIAWQANFLSVIYSLATLAFGAAFLYLLTKNSYFPAIGILILAFTYLFWHHSGIAQAHTLERAIFALALLQSLWLTKSPKPKYFLLLGLTFGLGFGNHLLLICSIPGFAFFLLIHAFKGTLKLTIPKVLLFILGGVLGLSVYLLLLIREYFGPTFLSHSVANWEGFYRHVASTDSQGLMLQGGWPTIFDNMVKGLKELALAYTPIPFYVGLLGVSYGLYRYLTVTLTLGLMFFGYLLFSMNYPTGDPTRYYTSFLFIYALFIGLGCFSLFDFIKLTAQGLKLPTMVGLFISGLLFFFLLLIPLQFIQTNYKSVDKSKQVYATQYATKIMQEVSPNAVILSWWNYSTPLWYRNSVLHERQDITIINSNPWEWKSYIERYLPTRPVYIVENETALQADYNVTPFGWIYEVKPKK